MTIYDLKPKFQALLRPLVKSLHTKGFTPNQITWTALILSFLTGAMIALTQGSQWVLLLVPIVMFIRMAMNAIDGMLAKEFDMKTDAGAILNEMSDVAADAALYLPLVFVPNISGMAIVLFVVFSIFSEMAGVLAQVISGERRYDGPMGKSDRAFVFGLVCLLLGFGIEAGIWTSVVFLISTFLVGLTSLNRCKRALQ